MAEPIEMPFGGRSVGLMMTYYVSSWDITLTAANALVCWICKQCSVPVVDKCSLIQDNLALDRVQLPPA